MKVMLAGAHGQLGCDLVATAPAGVELDACNRTMLDITNSGQIKDRVSQYQPDVLINAAAYTAVDRAESDEESACSINATGVETLARVCRDAGVRLIHLSTDYVFDGQKNTPYQPADYTGPLGVYGRTKLAGEQAINSTEGLSANIVRVAWLYGQHGHNFVHTMLKLMKERTELNVVADQIGTPTWTKPLAQTLWQLASRPELSGTWHWADWGVASWYDFAKSIHRIGHELEVLDHKVDIRAITTLDYPTPAQRPVYSVLDSTRLRKTLELPCRHWCENLQLMMESEKHV
ncbi:MAG: dTDP-4-dehydrorhamnose reductase [Gammaproteobacteria bacterium]